ncbi:unnamed protein product [Clonostachys chloroleuca]|uniref:Protein transport protein sec73 n=1 Tax=Clonostachys chloroleuca TaxID=1926264 RepID=A0AA35PXP3_9HYPO|nr:unnamed protein product [Clonostachys chloroleuca]
MPFLRRRGNGSGDQELRRQNTVSRIFDRSEPSLPPANHLAAPAIQENEQIVQTRAASMSQRPDTPPIQEQTSKHKRFSVLRFRNASDSQLSLRAKQQAENPPPPVPRRPPEIITTAPTGEFVGPRKKSSRLSLAAKLRISHDSPRHSTLNGPPASRSFVDTIGAERRRLSLAPLEEPGSPRSSLQHNHTFNGTMGAPGPLTHRQSESSRSDLSSGDRVSQSSPATTPKKSPTSSTLFKSLRRSKKQPEPMFPISHLPQKDKTPQPGSSSVSLTNTPRPASVQSGRISRGQNERPVHFSPTTPAPATALFAPGGASRSGQSSPTRPNYLRERSSTMSSAGRDSTEDHHLTPATRTSSSTGRKSFGDLLGLGRLRQNSELGRQGTLTPATPGSSASKSNSLQLARDTIPLPERYNEESPAKYLARVEMVMNRGSIAAALSKASDSFSAAVLRSYMRSFSFFGDPMDMALRKLLMEAELPRETQQIDRCLQAFANRYHECNPGIYSSPDQAYFIAFSLLILHTDVFNKNNKYKMQKSDYLKNTNGEGIFDEILECFYDNISYTPFIHVEDELDLPLERASKSRTKQLLVANDPAKRAAKEPIDPYTLIIDGNLDALRPNLKDVMLLEEHYNYLGSATSLNMKDLQKTFFRTGVLQIVSARSRPDAFMSEKTATNPNDAHPGIVDIKVTKVGLLWRKDPKKRKTRSPWQEWGAILTGAQLYFFRNTSWVKNLMHQYDSHIRAGHDGIPVIFKPPLEEFKPDALMSTHDAVALHDSSYKKHKNAFVYVRSGGLDEVLLADTEDEMNDWLAKLNYAAAFRTTGVRMKGVVGGHYDGQGRRGIRRLDSTEGTQLIDTPSGQVAIARGQIDHKMAEDIQSARREFMLQKIAQNDESLAECQKKLDDQLRNARHLQILAPIQPRTREQLLEAAARISAQLKWTRTEMWREKCHRDILKLDLEEDSVTSPPATTPIKTHKREPSNDRPSTPTPTGKSEPLSNHQNGSNQEVNSTGSVKLDSLKSKEEPLPSPMSQEFQTPPQSASLKPGSRDSFLPLSDRASTRHGSVSSVAPSPVKRVANGGDSESRETEDTNHKRKTSHGRDDVDAEERDLLEQAGLLDAKSGSTNSEAHGFEGTENGEKSKARRSLHKTLRDSAGHLGHHRSRRGKEGNPTTPPDAASSESTLPRGAGSFTVHGKKASVINFGTGLAGIATDETLRTRKPSVSQDPPVSPAFSSGGEDDDFYSIADELEDQQDSHDRRESAASESTATARSFRELHRKYSTARAARSVSSGGRLAVPSDGESEVAVSFSEGRRSPLPPIDPDETEDEDSSVIQEGQRLEDAVPTGKE